MSRAGIPGKRRGSRLAPRPSERLKDLARAAGCSLTSLGDTEQLAGIDIRDEAQRRELWQRFSHLFAGPTQDLFDAAMDYCAAIALTRIEGGELCLLPTRW